MRYSGSIAIYIIALALNFTCIGECNALVVTNILQTDYPFSDAGKAYYSTTSGIINSPPLLLIII